MAENLGLPEGFVLDEPIEAGLPEGFVLDEPITEKKPKTSFLPRLAQVEEKIAARRNPFQALLEEGRKSVDPQKYGWLSTLLQPFVFGLKALDIPRRTIESPTASAGLAMQRGELFTPQAMQEVGRGIIGTREAELGDIVRTTGFGGVLNEPLSATTGMLALAGLMRPKKTIESAKRLAKEPITMAKEAVGEDKGGVQAVRQKVFRKGLDTKETRFAEKVRTSVYDAKHDAVEKFGQDIDNLAKANPNREVSLRNTVDRLKTEWNDLTPEAQRVFSKVPKFKEMLTNPDLANNISLRDTQEIINYFNTKVPKTIKYQHLDILDTLDDIRTAQLDAFPEMEQARASYAQVKQNFDIIKNKVKVGQTLKNVAKNWGDPEIKKAANTLLRGKDILQDIRNYQRNLKILKFTGLATKLTAKGAATGLGLGAILRLFGIKGFIGGDD